MNVEVFFFGPLALCGVLAGFVLARAAFAKVKAALSCRTPKPAALSNEAAARMALIGLSNEIKDTEDWFEFAPVGDFPHAQGIQRIDRTAVETMANEFNSVAGRLQRAFVGRPIWIGHHDEDRVKYPDPKAYGWITALQARDTGLYAKAKWTPEGKTLLANESFKFHSPRWDADPIGTEKGRRVYRPVAVISAGLTNEPNLPVKPLANEKEDDMTEEQKKQREALCKRLKLANTATDEEVNAAIEALETRATTLANDKSGADTALSNEKTEHGKTKTALSNALGQRNEAFLDLHARRGAVTPKNRKDWEEKLNADWEKNSKALANEKPQLKTESQLGDAGARRSGLSNVATGKFTSQVRTRMANEKLTWNQAWAAEKEMSADLYKQMEEEGAAAE